VGYWGVKSYEEDDADFALDAGFERVHGAVYLQLMDDRDPTPLEEVQRRLADRRTLAAALNALANEFQGRPLEEYDDDQRISYCGVVVRHVECGVVPPRAVRDRALRWLQEETVEWDDPAARRRRLAWEIELLRRTAVVEIEEDTAPLPDADAPASESSRRK